MSLVSLVLYIMHKFVQNLTKIVSDRQVILYMERLEQTRDVFKVFLGGVAVAVAVPGRSSYGATFMVPLKILSSFEPVVPLFTQFWIRICKRHSKFSALAT